MPDQRNLFDMADIIDTYTRAEAIEDGFLVGSPTTSLVRPASSARSP